jgi:hypothetical protein
VNMNAIVSEDIMPSSSGRKLVTLCTMVKDSSYGCKLQLPVSP